MGKAILVIDNMPSSCYECPLCYFDTDYDYVCSALTIKAKDDYTDDIYEIVDVEKWTDYRYSKCPLKHMPTHVIDRNTFAIENKYANYQDGYNECIDVISGENK